MPDKVPALAAVELPAGPPRFDVPTPDLPLQARVERLAAPLRMTIASMAGRLEEATVRSYLDLLRAPDPAVDDAVVRVPEPSERVARVMVSIWLIETLRSEAAESVAAANARFWGERLDCPQPDGLAELERAIDRRGYREARDLLPYLLDPFGLTTRRAVIAGAGELEERRARKEIGTFYTPGDVVRLLAEETLVGASPSVVDPACGAGVFLRAAFGRLVDDLDCSPAQAISRIYGIDVDCRGIVATCAVLAHDWLAREPDDSPGAGGARWRSVRLNLAVGDSLAMFSGRSPLGDATAVEASDRKGWREELRAGASAGPRPAPPSAAARGDVWHRFPERDGSRFDCVLMNPPFASAGTPAERGPEVARTYEALSAAANPARVNLAWPFTELALRAAGPGGRLGVVLPLSVAYLRSPSVVALRRAMTRGAAWRLRFLDRAPDAVFGDDVKQRICLATARKQEPGSVATSRLIRWSIGQRADVFKPGVGRFQVQVPAAGDRFPKIGTALEAEALTGLAGRTASLGDGALDAGLLPPTELSDETGCAVAVAPTAYNWIGTYRDVDLARKGRAQAAGSMSVLLFGDRERADAAYALLASRVFLWWWRATGDLFHVPLRTLTEAPFPVHTLRPAALEDLASAGRDLWARAVGNEVRSVNRGVAVCSYPPPDGAAELDAADRSAVAAFELPEQFAEFARQDAKRLSEAGRER